MRKCLDHITSDSSIPSSRMVAGKIRIVIAPFQRSLQVFLNMHSNDQHYSLLPKQGIDEEVFSRISEHGSILAGQRARPGSRCLKLLGICAVQIALLAAYTVILVSAGQWFAPGLFTGPKPSDLMCRFLETAVSRRG